MNISLSATNPCHLYDLAKALHATHSLSRYYSGYPGWKLQSPADFPLRGFSTRTLVTYGCLRLPNIIRPRPHRLFRWQDRGFDRAVSRAVATDPGTSIHAMPGQALETFRAARRRNIQTVLNHASGPVRQQLALVEEEYRRAGVSMEQHHAFDASYFSRADEEYALADRHCVASTVVQRQLAAAGVDPARIWIVPYASDPRVFFPAPAGAPRDTSRIVYAGQISLRKGLRIAFAAVNAARASRPLSFDLYGATNSEMTKSLAAVANTPGIRLHGPVSQTELGGIFRSAGMLVLPSWEEAFGLVVVQALSCGLPCIVSDRVGASDLIEQRRNGSVFPAGDADALAREILWWSDHSDAFQFRPHAWEQSARRLLELTQASGTA